MAEDPLASRGRAANVSRRALLTGIAALPAASRVVISTDPSAWQQALDAYVIAHQTHEDYLADVLRPAYRRFDADLASRIPLQGTRKRLMRQHRIFELEERGNDLAANLHDALHQLITVPAIDRDSALTKMRLAYLEILRHEDHDEIVRPIFADVDRLWH